MRTNIRKSNQYRINQRKLNKENTELNPCHSDKCGDNFEFMGILQTEYFMG